MFQVLGQAFHGAAQLPSQLIQFLRVFLSSSTSGAILIASGRVPKIVITFHFFLNSLHAFHIISCQIVDLLHPRDLERYILFH